jgi:hypothetical protein
MRENISVLLRQIMESRLERVHTWLPAKIIEFDHTTLRAIVEPTIKKVVGPDGNETKLPYPLLLEVPVDVLLTEYFVIRPPYKEDDTVSIGFYERSIERILRDIEQRDPYFSRKHHLTDALVVQGRMTDKEGEDRPLPSGWDDELIIHTRELGTAIRLDPSGNIGIQVEPGKKLYLGPGVINGEMESIAIDGAILGTRHKAWADNHVHSCPCGCTTNPPTEPCPEVSEHVFVGE